eukprot:5397435-Pleurochrysis_carterae.AAC.5
MANEERSAKSVRRAWHSESALKAQNRSETEGSAVILSPCWCLPKPLFAFPFCRSEQWSKTRFCSDRAKPALVKNTPEAEKPSQLLSMTHPLCHVLACPTSGWRSSLARSEYVRAQ